MTEYTTKLQKHKLDSVSELKEIFSAAKDFIFTDYRGLNVEQITNLRGRLRQNGASLRVVKNRFAKIAMRELELPDAATLLVGPTALALTVKDAGPVAKILVEFSDESPITLKGGIIDGALFDGEQVTAFSRLPSKSELIAKLMSAMNGSLMNLMYVIQAVPQKLVRTLAAVAEQRQEQGK